MSSKIGPDQAWYIYTLIDPRTGAVRYVGWTVDPRNRLRLHLNEARYQRPGRVFAKTRWMANLLRLGLVPTMTVIDQGVGTGWSAAETRWIAHYRGAGADLLNLTEGGDGTPGRKVSDETRAKLAALRPSPEARARMSASHTGKKHSLETRAKMSAARAGKADTPAMTAGRRRRRQSPETRAKMSASAKAWRAAKRLADPTRP